MLLGGSQITGFVKQNGQIVMGLGVIWIGEYGSAIVILGQAWIA